MMDTLIRSMDELLRDAMFRLQTSVEGVVVAAVVSNDGLSLASTLTRKQHEDMLAAMSASMHLLGDRIARELMASKSSQVVILAEKGAILMMAVGSEATLLCIARKDASLGLVMHQMRRASGEVLHLLNGNGYAGEDGEMLLQPEYVREAG